LGTGWLARARGGCACGVGPGSAWATGNSSAEVASRSAWDVRTSQKGGLGVGPMGCPAGTLHGVRPGPRLRSVSAAVARGDRRTTVHFALHLQGLVRMATFGLERARFARSPVAVAPVEGETMSWNLEGDFYENCSCDAICPCTWSNLAHKATRDDYCRFALAFDVESGQI